MQPYIITPPTSGIYPVSFEMAKAQCRVDIDLEQDLIIRLIKAAWRYAEHFQQRTLLPTTYGMKLDHFHHHWWGQTCYYHNEIRLPMPNLRSVVSVAYTAPNGDQITLDGSQYEFDATATPGVIYPAYGCHWPDTRHHKNSVTIQWTAGYDDPNSIPAETQSGILLLVGHLFEHREAVTDITLTEVPMAVGDLLSVNCWGNYS